MKKPLFTVLTLAVALMIASRAGTMGLVASATSNNTATGNDTVTPSESPSDEDEDSYDDVENSSDDDEDEVDTVLVADGSPLVLDVAWDQVGQTIDAALRALAADRENKNIDVVVGTRYTIPSSILDKLVGNDAVLALQTGNRLAFTISSADLRRTGATFSMNLSYESGIPEAVKAQVTQNAVYSREFSMANKGAFGFKVDVHLNMGAENAGKNAALYYYDEARGTMVVAGRFKVTENGQVMFALSRGDEYVVVVTE